MKRSIRLYGEFLCNFFFVFGYFFGLCMMILVFSFFYLFSTHCSALYLMILLSRKKSLYAGAALPPPRGLSRLFSSFILSLLLCLPELLCFVILLCRLSHFSYNFQTIQTQLFFSSTHSSLIAPRSRMTWCVLCSIFMQTSPAEHERAEQNFSSSTQKS